MKFPSSGKVRLQWTYPNGDPLLPATDAGQAIASRTFSITVH